MWNLKKESKSSPSPIVSRSIDMTMAARRNIPHDLAEEILVQLPFKSLMRFRSVSKQWDLLFSDSKFIETNEAGARAPLNNHKNYFLSYRGCEPYIGIIDGCIDESKGVLRAVATSKSPMVRNVHINTAQCGGLLCLLNHGKLVVWNPSTNEHKKYPLPPTVHCCYCKGLGLGHAVISDEYKVVVVSSSLQSSDDSLLHVLSLKTGAWKALENSKHYKSLAGSLDRVATAFNGSLYWNMYDSIVCFDLETERDRVMINGNHAILRDGPRRAYRRCKLRASEESLYLASFGRCCDVWVRRKNKDWMKLFSSQHPRLYGGDHRYGRILCLIGNDKILIKENGRKALVLCNLRDNSSKEIVVHGQGLQWYDNLECVVSYEESLVRPGGNLCV